MLFIASSNEADYSERNIGRAIQLTADRTNLVGEYLFGRNFNTSKPNSAAPANPLSTVGTHTYGTRKVTMSGASNRLELNVPDAQELTVLVIASAANNCQFLGSFNGSNSTDCAALLRPTGGIQGQVAAADNTAVTTTAIAVSGTASEPRGVAMRTTGSADFVIKVDQFKAGARINGVSEPKAGKTRKVSSNTFRIGAPTTFYIGSFDTYAALIWHRALGDVELLAAYQEVFDFFEQLGIAV